MSNRHPNNANNSGRGHGHYGNGYLPKQQQQYPGPPYGPPPPPPRGGNGAGTGGGGRFYSSKSNGHGNGNGQGQGQGQGHGHSHWQQNQHPYNRPRSSFQMSNNNANASQQQQQRYSNNNYYGSGGRGGVQPPGPGFGGSNSVGGGSSVASNGSGGNGKKRSGGKSSSASNNNKRRVCSGWGSYIKDEDERPSVNLHSSWSKQKPGGGGGGPNHSNDNNNNNKKERNDDDDSTGSTTAAEAEAEDVTAGKSTSTPNDNNNNNQEEEEEDCGVSIDNNNSTTTDSGNDNDKTTKDNEEETAAQLLSIKNSKLSSSSPTNDVLLLSEPNNIVQEKQKHEESTEKETTKATKVTKESTVDATDALDRKQTTNIKSGTSSSRRRRTQEADVNNENKNKTITMNRCASSAAPVTSKRPSKRTLKLLSKDNNKKSNVPVVNEQRPSAASSATQSRSRSEKKHHHHHLPSQDEQRTTHHPQTKRHRSSNTSPSSSRHSPVVLRAPTSPPTQVASSSQKASTIKREEAPPYTVERQDHYHSKRAARGSSSSNSPTCNATISKHKTKTTTPDKMKSSSQTTRIRSIKKTSAATAADNRRQEDTSWLTKPFEDMTWDEKIYSQWINIDESAKYKFSDSLPRFLLLRGEESAVEVRRKGRAAQVAIERTKQQFPPRRARAIGSNDGERQNHVAKSRDLVVVPPIKKEEEEEQHEATADGTRSATEIMMEEEILLQLTHEEESKLQLAAHYLSDDDDACSIATESSTYERRLDQLRRRMLDQKKKKLKHEQPQALFKMEEVVSRTNDETAAAAPQQQGDNEEAEHEMIMGGEGDDDGTVKVEHFEKFMNALPYNYVFKLGFEQYMVTDDEANINFCPCGPYMTPWLKQHQLMNICKMECPENEKTFDGISFIKHLRETSEKHKCVFHYGLLQYVLCLYEDDGAGETNKSIGHKFLYQLNDENYEKAEQYEEEEFHRVMKLGNDAKLLQHEKQRQLNETLNAEQEYLNTFKHINYDQAIEHEQVYKIKKKLGLISKDETLMGSKIHDDTLLKQKQVEMKEYETKWMGMISTIKSVLLDTTVNSSGSKKNVSMTQEIHVSEPFDISQMLFDHYHRGNVAGSSSKSKKARSLPSVFFPRLTESATSSPTTRSPRGNSRMTKQQLSLADMLGTWTFQYGNSGDGGSSPKPKRSNTDDEEGSDADATTTRDFYTNFWKQVGQTKVIYHPSQAAVKGTRGNATIDYDDDDLKTIPLFEHAHDGWKPMPDDKLEHSIKVAVGLAETTHNADDEAKAGEEYLELFKQVRETYEAIGIVLFRCLWEGHSKIPNYAMTKLFRQVILRGVEPKHVRSKDDRIQMIDDMKDAGFLKSIVDIVLPQQTPTSGSSSSPEKADSFFQCVVQHKVVSKHRIAIDSIRDGLTMKGKIHIQDYLSVFPSTFIDHLLFEHQFTSQEVIDVLRVEKSDPRAAETAEEQIKTFIQTTLVPILTDMSSSELATFVEFCTGYRFIPIVSNNNEKDKTSFQIFVQIAKNEHSIVDNKKDHNEDELSMLPVARANENTLVIPSELCRVSSGDGIDRDLFLTQLKKAMEYQRRGL